jgi:hypothetical protein
MQFLEEHATPNAQSAKGKKSYSKQTAAMIAIRGRKIVYATMDEVKAKADMKLRKGIDEWWSGIKPMAEVSLSPLHYPFGKVANTIGHGWSIWISSLRTSQGEGCSQVNRIIQSVLKKNETSISKYLFESNIKIEQMHRWCPTQ